MSYGTAIPDMWRQVGVYSGQVLKGARRLTSKLPCFCTVAGSGWCASVRVW